MARFTPPTEMTKTQRLHWSFAVDAQQRMEQEIMDYVAVQGRIPLAWHEVWEDKNRRDPKRVRVTCRLDADVVKFFKTMGEGYQARINTVLRSYMHLRLAGMVNGPDTTDYVLRPAEVMAQARGRDDWGDMAKVLGEGDE